MKNLNMSNNSLERLSFHEVSTMLSGASHADSRMRVIGHDMAMLRSGELLFPSVVRPGVPYIMEDSRIGMLRNGEARLTINLIEHKMRKGMLAFIGTGSIIQMEEVSDDFDLCGMMISDGRMKGALKDGMPTWCVGNATFFSLAPSPSEFDFVGRLFDAAWTLIGQERFPDETLNGIIYAVVYYYNYLKDTTLGTSIRQMPRSREIFERFITFVNAFGRREHDISFYADKMCITPRYLGTAVKAASGITAKEWIDRAVVTNAKIMLKYGDGQIAGISDSLNFANTSFFCKFFKRLTGMTPMEYRKL